MRVRDPVCGMEIESEYAAARVEWKGAVYFFCAKACRAAFEQDPVLFAEVAGVLSVGGIRSEPTED